MSSGLCLLALPPTSYAAALVPCARCATLRLSALHARSQGIRVCVHVVRARKKLVMRDTIGVLAQFRARIVGEVGLE
jgi:hypothetical protein